MQITPKEGVPIIVKNDISDSTRIIIKRVNELGFYNLDFTQLAEKTNLNRYQLQALIWHLCIKQDIDCYKNISIGKSLNVGRYSQKAIIKINEYISDNNYKTVIDKYKTYLSECRKSKKQP